MAATEFNRERFLFWLLAAVLGVNASFFAYGLIACSMTSDPTKTCPEIGTRFDNFSEKSTAAVLGLIAGAGITAVATKRKDGNEGATPNVLSNAQPIPPDPASADAGIRPGQDEAGRKRRGKDDQKSDDKRA